MTRPAAPLNERALTLVEMLVGVAVLGILGIAIGAMSTGGTTRAAQESLRRGVDSNTVELASTWFARDIQGASGITATQCGAGLGGTALVSLLVPASAPTGGAALMTAGGGPATITYRSVTGAKGQQVVRARCTGGAPVESDVVADELTAPPTVTCDGTACAPAERPTPRQVRLDLSTGSGLVANLDGARRATVSGASDPPFELPRLLGLSSAPLSVSGNAGLVVNGPLYVNRPSSGTVAVNVQGNAGLAVNGTFAVPQGTSCSGCGTKGRPTPTAFDGPLPDPLAYLQAPSGSGLSNRTCNKCTSMQPGIYKSVVSLSGNANVTMAPGVYILRKGISVSGNVTLTGNGVFLYNGCEREQPASCSAAGGAVSLGGGGSVTLSPLATGHPAQPSYPGVLLFQARNNTAAISIGGNSSASSLSGIIYAPGSAGVQLGAGNGGLSIGWVVGTNLSVSGNGTVRVG